MKALVRAASSVVSSKGASARLLILFYHRVHPVADPLRPSDVDVDTFDWQMEVLSRYFTPLALGHAVELLRQGKLPANAVCVTFDDGYADNVEVALPVLQRWAVPATFFLTTGFFGHGCMWNDRVIELLRNVDTQKLSLSNLRLGEYKITSMSDRLKMVNSVLRQLKHLAFEERDQQVQRLENELNINVSYSPMMREEQVSVLIKSGMSVGAHTVNHPILSRISLDEAKQEIETGKRQLEALTKKEVTLFAYPNGVPGKDYEAEHVGLVKAAGFDAAFSTAWAAVQCTDDFMQLPRIAPWDNTRLRFYLRLLRSYRTGNAEHVVMNARQ
ncbi:MAG: polysaccharide deacetylase family protein [Gammaproteobacteria bacterium]|nr:polysaccharide deacetylase family protein [Gammaproteobacteria bacterium]MCF6259235.1 polysaccharide deacetylase family protein [Gammaproteobacteria bacterium]